MKKTLDCVTVGASLLDTYVQLKSVTHRPDPKIKGGMDACFVLGTKNDVDHIIQSSGGGATNAAVTFVRQRLSVSVVSKVGYDSAADIILNELAEERVGIHTIIQTKGDQTGQSVILVDPDAERTVFTDRGMAGHITVADLHLLSDLKPRWLYITSLNGSVDALDFIFDWAEAQGAKIAWNPGMADIHRHAAHIGRLIPKTSFFLANKEEATELFGIDGSVKELVQKIDALNAPRSIVSDGWRTLAAADHGSIWTLDPHNVKALDESGAGDAFGSGTVAGLLQGLDFKESVELGLANSEHVIMHLGAKTGIVYRK